MLVFVPKGMLGVRLTVSAIFGLSCSLRGWYRALQNWRLHRHVCVSRLNGVVKHNCRMWGNKCRHSHCAPLHAVSVQFSVLFVCAFGAVKTVCLDHIQL